MKYAIALAIFIAFGVSAQARLTPFQSIHRAAGPGLASPFPGSARARLERDFFQAAAPQVTPEKIGPCTVSIFVFTKARLAQACY